METSIVLIGVTGFVGSAFKHYFDKNDISFVGINRSNYEDYKGLSGKVLINADGNSKKYVARDEPVNDFKMNVLTTMQTLQDFEADRYVFISSIDVYEDYSTAENNHEEVRICPANLSNYGMHKYMAELCIKKYAPSWLIVRLGGMVGEGLKKNSIFDLLHRDKLWVHPDSAYQYIYTDEVAKVVMKLIEKDYENEVFNICGDGVVTIREVAEEIIGVPIESYEWRGNKEYYEVNINKVKKIQPIQSTRVYIESYIESQKDRIFGGQI